MAANILIVEENELIRNVICKVLRKEGYKIVEATDGGNALDLLYAQCFDLVITDFVTPKLNELKFVERLHTLQGPIPIIFITGHLSAISLKAILDDVAEVLPKPFELDRPPAIRRLLKPTPH
jgi:two-component system, OmpR family, response regulator